MADQGILKNLNAERLKRLIITIEMLAILTGAVSYYQFPRLFLIYLPLLLVVHCLTLLPLPSIFKKLRTTSQDELLHFSGVSQQEEGLLTIDLWDRAVLAFYIITNLLLFITLCMLIFF